MIRVFIPPAARALTSQNDHVDVEASTVGEAIEALERQFPGIRDGLCVEHRLRPGMSVAINGNIATLGLRQPVPPGAEVHFLPSLGGG